MKNAKSKVDDQPGPGVNPDPIPDDILPTAMALINSIKKDIAKLEKILKFKPAPPPRKKK